MYEEVSIFGEDDDSSTSSDSTHSSDFYESSEDFTYLEEFPSYNFIKEIYLVE